MAVLGEDPEVLGSLGFAYAKRGDRLKAQGLLAQLEARARESYVSPYQRGSIHLALGEREQALADFQHAMDDRSLWLPWLRCDARLAEVRGDQRFPAPKSATAGFVAMWAAPANRPLPPS